MKCGGEKFRPEVFVGAGEAFQARNMSPRPSTSNVGVSSRHRRNFTSASDGKMEHGILHIVPTRSSGGPPDSSEPRSSRHACLAHPKYIGSSSPTGLHPPGLRAR